MAALRGALVWAVTAAIVLAIAVAVVIPRLAGATPYTVLTASMRPELPPGSLVVVRPAAPERIGVGSIITYQLRSGEPEVVTHRVVTVRQDLTGERVFTTQGDANAVADREEVRPVQIRGEVWYAVPHLGRAATWLSSAQRETASTVVAAGLLAYAGLMFVRAGRERSGPRAGRHRVEAGVRS